MSKRPLIVGLLGFAVAGLVVAPAQPAAAYKGEDITIKPGQTLLLKKDAIPGVSVQFQSSSPHVVPLVASGTPAECEADAVGCEMLPLHLDVPEDDPDLLEAKGYILTVVMSWDPGQSVENLPEVGTVRQNDLQGFLFQDPQIRNSAGTASFTSRTQGNAPGTMIAVNPTSREHQIVVANYSGVNNGYTLEISLESSEDLEFDPGEFNINKPPPDYVQPTYTPPKSTPRDNGFGGGSLPPLSPPSPTAPMPAVDQPIVVPNIAAGRPDTRLLAMSQLVVKSGLGRSAVEVESKVIAATVEKSSAAKIWLTLLVLPLLAVVTAIVLLLRRRKSDAPVVAV